MSVNTPHTHTLGAILAGGKSRRMGATTDKCMLEFNGQTLLHRAVMRAKHQVGPLVICTNGDTQRFSDINTPIITDTQPGYLGPAAGIISAFEWAQHRQLPALWISTFAVDTPFFPLDLTQKLLAHANTTDAEVVIPYCDQKHHYAFGLWSMDAAAKLSDRVTSGERAIKHLLTGFRHGALDLSTSSHQAAHQNCSDFFNVNTPVDWKQLKPLNSQNI